MKKVFLAVLAIAAMMVSCQKEGLVDNQKETPEVEVNEPQPVILGSNLFKAPTTKASIDNMSSWLSDMKNNEDEIDKFIYVWALNGKENATNDYMLIINHPATLEENGIGELTGSLDLKENGKPIYYNSNDYDRYNFYSYYLGYKLDYTEEVYPEAVCVNNVIEVRDVEIRGYNDIMIASTDKAADAIVDGTMVNPKYLYSEYSARHHVRPNLVFKHQLSKFSFNVRYDGDLAENDKIYLEKITFEGEKKTGRLVLNKVEEGDEPGLYIAAQENQGDVFNKFENFILDKANNDSEQHGYQPAGNLMVVPAGEGGYDLIINLKQMFNGGTETKQYDNTVTIIPGMVKTEDESEVLRFEAGKHYVVNITVYGLQTIFVNVQLTEWDYVGDITFDPDQKEDGFMQQVNATLGEDENARPCTLYAEEFTDGKDIWCVFTGEEDPKKGKLVSAPAGTYTVTGTEGDLVEETTITVEVEGKIANVVTPGQETQEVE